MKNHYLRYFICFKKMLLLYKLSVAIHFPAYSYLAREIIYIRVR